MKVGEIKTAENLVWYSSISRKDKQTIIVWKDGVGTYTDNPSWKAGLYIEDGMLEETEFLVLNETDDYGRPIRDIGTFKVLPNYFDVELRTTYNKDRTWYDYKLNVYGWEQLEANGLKHPGRGWVSYDLITNDDIRFKIEENANTADTILRKNIELSELLKK